MRFLVFVAISIVLLIILFVGAVTGSAAEPTLSAKITAEGDIGIARATTAQFWTTPDVGYRRGYTEGYTHASVTKAQGETLYASEMIVQQGLSEAESAMWTDANVITDDRAYTRSSILYQNLLECDILLENGGNYAHIHAQMRADTLNFGVTEHHSSATSTEKGAVLGITHEADGASMFVGAMRSHMRNVKATEDMRIKEDNEEMLNLFEVLWQRIGTERTKIEVEYAAVGA